MLAIPEKFCKKIMSSVLMSSEFKIEVLKDLLRNSVESNAVKVDTDDCVPNTYEIFLPSEELRKGQGLLLQIKTELECYINKYAEENGFETTSPITVVFRQSDEDNTENCRCTNIEAKLDTDDFIGTAAIEDVKSHREYPLLLKENRVGRSHDNDIILQERTVSAHHIVIKNHNNAWSAIDSKSKNATLVNYQPIMNSSLNDGDVIQLGKATLLFKLTSRRN